MTDVPDLVRVSVVALISNSDHSSLSAVISMAQMLQSRVLVGKFPLNIKLIEIQFAVQCSICHGAIFGLLTILLRFLMSICCCWLDVLFQPRSSVCATRIRLGLINAGALLASSRRLIFGGPVIALGLTGAFTKPCKREGGAGAEGAILPYVGHLQLISTFKIGADCCQLCQYKLTKPNLT